VLVPGAGLARLLVDVAALGLEAQGNEFSYYMLLGGSFMLNHTVCRDQWRVHPWMHTNLNHLSDEDQVRRLRRDPGPRPGGPASVGRAAGGPAPAPGGPRRSWLRAGALGAMPARLLPPAAISSRLPRRDQDRRPPAPPGALSCAL
jgi:hypothetical protein